MATNDEYKRVYIHGKRFRDVTNETTSGEIMNYTEAERYARTGERITTSD